MTQVEGLAAVPVVNVADIQEALDFYVGSLGFEQAFQVGPYAGVQLGAAMIHLNGGSDSWNARPTSVRVTVDGIDDYHEAMDGLGLVKADEPLQDTPFGHRQFSVLDPTQNRITFVQFDT